LVHNVSMNSADQILLRLADPVARPSLLTSEQLLGIATTTYDIDAGLVVGPTTAVYDTVDVGVSVGSAVSGTGRWGKPTDAVSTESIVTVTGLVPPSPGADAVWVGSVVLRVGSGLGAITAADVTDQGRNGDGADRLGVAVTFAAPPVVDQNTTATILPVIVAFIVADADASPRALLQQSESARRAALRYAVTAPPSGAPNVRFDRTVCWVLPETAFDDAGWPGGGAGDAAQQRAARLSAARLWLADQGIALVTTSPP
jgi:hypothetical protein